MPRLVLRLCLVDTPNIDKLKLGVLVTLSLTL